MVILGILIWNRTHLIYMPRKTRISLSLPTTLVEQIDSLAESSGVNRSDFIADKVYDALGAPNDDDSYTEDNVDDDQVNLTDEEQALFDAGVEYGREVALEKSSIDAHLGHSARALTIRGVFLVFLPGALQPESPPILRT